MNAKIVEEIHSIVLTCVKAQKYQRKISVSVKSGDFIDDQGLYSPSNIMDYMWKCIEYFNTIGPDEVKCKVSQDGDMVYYDFNQIPIPSSLKSFISPRSVRLDPTTKRTKDLLERKAGIEVIDITKYFECLRSFNGLMYGEYSEESHIVKLDDCRTDESLTTFVERAACGDKCLLKEEGLIRFDLSKKALEALVEVNYFNDTLSNNNQCLKKHFKLDL